MLSKPKTKLSVAIKTGQNNCMQEENKPKMFDSIIAGNFISEYVADINPQSNKIKRIELLVLSFLSGLERDAYNRAYVSPNP